jgi:hypothetical protein
MYGAALVAILVALGGLFIGLGVLFGGRAGHALIIIGTCLFGVDVILCLIGMSVPNG